MKTVLLISAEKMFAESLVDFLTGDRFPVFNLLYINSPMQITDSLVYEDIDLIINDLTFKQKEFDELILQIHRAHQNAKQIDIYPYERERNDRNSVSRNDSLARLENVIKALMTEDEAYEKRTVKDVTTADKYAAMIIANLERLYGLYALYEQRDKKKFMMLIESVLNVNRNHNRLSRLAGELLVSNMTAFANNFAGIFSLHNEFEEAQFPELNFSDQVNNRMLFAFWQRFADMIFSTPSQEKIPAVVTRAKEFVAENLRSELTVTMIADAVGVTSGYLSRIFSANEGKTLIHFVSEMKIEKSKQMLEDEKNSIKLIAGEIGFSSPSYFIRFFKKFTGVTPKQYREGLHYKSKDVL